jgi:Brp/Blh family beta-carotene 15,15'-monooxygenase
VADDQFADLAFRRLPLACLAAAAVAGGILGPGWSAGVEALPWLVALAAVGLAHGAADLAVSRSLCAAERLPRVWATYAATMATVATAYAIAPIAVLVLFALLSAWHFGQAAANADGPERESCAWAVWVRPLARGGWMLGVPLAAWPADTADVAADLLRLTGQGGQAVISPQAVMTIRGLGLALVAAAASAAASEWAGVRRRRDRTRRRARLLAEVAAITAIGVTTEPLFSIGITFLVWHAWRQMAPLAVLLGGGPPASWSDLWHALVRIHGAALPLLLPAWFAIGWAWWILSPAHTPRDLAILSIAAYLVVTPSHERLGGMLLRPCMEPTASCQRSCASCSA